MRKNTDARSWMWFVLIAGAALLILTGTGIVVDAEDEAPPREPTQAELDLWFAHVREHFDDIHDVSMRFHLEDPGISGLITLRTTWAGGRFVNGEVVGNETGNDAEGEALLTAVRSWKVEGLQDPVTIQTSFRIKLVGSDDPSFAERGIVTGTVNDGDGHPIGNATVHFERVGTTDAEVPDARTNREGVIVRTLIPPGEWRLEVSADGHQPYRSEVVVVGPGTHHIERVVLATGGE